MERGSEAKYDGAHCCSTSIHSEEETTAIMVSASEYLAHGVIPYHPHGLQGLRVLLFAVSMLAHSPILPQHLCAIYVAWSLCASLV